MSTESDELNVYRDWLGIPEGDLPDEGSPDHYALLRLPQFTDDPEVIRKNYRKLNEHVRAYATGQYGLQSQELLNELAKAMLCLTDPDRKRDYDEQHGREFEPSAEEALGRMPMGRWLVKKKTITRDQLKEAESFAEARGLSLRDAVVQMKFVKPSIAARALAQSLGLGYVDLKDTVPDDSVLDKLPRTTVKHHGIMPLFVDDDMLLVACLDDPPQEIEDELRMRYNVPTRWVIAVPLAMNQAIAKYYAPGARDSAVEEEATKSSAGKSAKPKKIKPAYSELSADERQQRFQVGAMIIGWGAMLPLIVPPLLDFASVRINLSGWVQLLIAIVLAAIGTSVVITQRYMAPRTAGIAFGIACVAAGLAVLVGSLFS